MDSVNYNQLPDDLQKKLKKWEDNSPANQQLKLLTDIVDKIQKVIVSVGNVQSNNERGVGDLGAVLLDIRESIDELVKKESPESPDFSKPIVEAVSKLEKALSAIDVKPNVNVSPTPVKVPDVTVSAPDLKGVEKILKTDIPKAFTKAIDLIPTVEVPETDLTPVADALKAIKKQLDSIDIGVRLKPLPGSMKVLNPDGTSIGGTGAMPTTLLAFVTAVATAGTRVQLASNTVVNGFIIEAPSTNTGIIYVGGATVSSTAYGAELQAGQSTSVMISNTNKIYIDASVSADKASVLGS